MRTILTALLAGIGIGLLLGGLFTVIGGHLDHEPQELHNLGPLNGVWQANQARFFGAVIASLGGGLFTFALLARRKD